MEQNNEKERPTEKGHPTELSGNQNILFPVSASRWERYAIVKLGFRNRSGGEVFFEPGTNGKDIQNSEERVIDDYNHKIKKDGIVPAVRQTFGNGHAGNGAKIINLEPGANQANRRYDTKGISPTIPTAGGGQAYPDDK